MEKLSFFERYPFYQRMCLIYTLRCNVECDHCILHCHPGQEEKMDVDYAKKILKTGASLGKRLVIFSGGEVFLYYKELLELVAYSTQLGLEVDIETNGFWGKTFLQAKKKLEALAKRGLKVICLSVDRYHDRYIPTQYQLNIIRASQEVGIHNEVTFCTSSDRDQDITLMKKVENEAEFFYIQPLAHIGRAVEKLEKIVEVPAEELNPCDSLCTTFLPNGDTFACCEVSSNNNDLIDTPMYLGNCLLQNPEDVLKCDNQLQLGDFFCAGSSNWFKNFLGKKEFKEKWKTRKFNSICELCKEMMAVKAIRNQVIGN